MGSVGCEQAHLVVREVLVYPPKYLNQYQPVDPPEVCVSLSWYIRTSWGIIQQPILLLFCMLWQCVHVELAKACVAAGACATAVREVLSKLGS